MKKSLLVLAGIILPLIGCSVSAEVVTQHNVTIDILGSHKGNTFYMSLEEGLSRDCKYGLVYCSVDMPECKSMLSVALVAKSTGKKLSDFRFEYDEATTMCTGWLIAIN